MAFAAERVQFRDGEVLLKEGAKGNSAYFILSGSVDLVQGRKSTGRAEPGALLGELAMIGGSSYSLTATAIDAVSAVRIDQNLFQRVAGEYPEFGKTVLDNVSDKLARSVRELEGVRGLLTKARGFSDL
jgi:CRP/FNR family transcriptional regulator, cyclic AMP receptor protein